MAFHHYAPLGALGYAPGHPAAPLAYPLAPGYGGDVLAASSVARTNAAAQVAPHAYPFTVGASPHAPVAAAHAGASAASAVLGAESLHASRAAQANLHAASQAAGLADSVARANLAAAATGRPCSVYGTPVASGRPFY